MSRIPRASMKARIAVLTMFLFSLVPLQAAAEWGDPGTSYQSETLGYTLTWTEDWEPDTDLAMLTDDSEILILWNGSAFVMVAVIGGGFVTPEDMLTPDAEDAANVVEEDYSGPVGRVVLDDGVTRDTSEAQTIDDGQGGELVVLVSLVADVASADDVMTDAQNAIAVNGSPVLTGEVIAGNGESTAATGSDDDQATATEEEDSSDEEESDTSRTTSPTRNRVEETPEADAAEGQSYEGSVYGYTLQFDSTIWEQQETYDSEDGDGIFLTSDIAALTIYGTAQHGADAQSCMDAMLAEYDAPEYEDFEILTNADGEDLRYDSSDFSWAVVGFIHTSESGKSQPLFEYISCESIPGQDAVLVVFLSTTPEQYNSALDDALDIHDTVQFADTSSQSRDTQNDETPTPEEKVEATEEATEEATSDAGEQTTSLVGSVYTSPNYNFVVEVPLEWDILDEVHDGTDEQLVLGNGTSVVTLWATEEYQGDLAGCVDFAADASGLNLKLDTNSSGGDFRGVYRNEAFGNFVYESEDGEEMMYFISCQAIEGTDGYFILIHDVPYADFSTERRYRSDIESGISMP